jgi:hypothetical protein
MGTMIELPQGQSPSGTVPQLNQGTCTFGRCPRIPRCQKKGNTYRRYMSPFFPPISTRFDRVPVQS